tara:strand:- start:595 stop:1815 length:1221 start_codon:yes stop_codon:yes gene_type:complete
MVGPNFWRHPTNGLKKCSEIAIGDCGQSALTDCCAVVPCTYCLELETYSGGIEYGTTTLGVNGWTGTVGGYTFEGYWERNYTTDECEFIVIFDGVEAYRKSCYEGQSCRDSSDSASVTVNYEDGTLTWIKSEPLPLPHIVDPDTGCKTWFCGDCECSCDCLCVTITEPDTTVSSGELCNVSYECDGPRWEGQIGYFDLALALGRDSYGNCVLESTIDGDTQDAVAVTGCKDMTATITLYDGTTIAVACKVCSCVADGDCPCCPGWPLTSSGIINWSTINTAITDCVPGIGDPQEVSSDFGCIGTLNEGIIWTVDLSLYVRVYCENGAWICEYKSPATGPTPGAIDAPGDWLWVDAGATVSCPDCANAVGGIATGTIDFTATMRCEISGPTFIDYDVLCHGDIEIGC